MASVCEWSVVFVSNTLSYVVLTRVAALHYTLIRLIIYGFKFNALLFDARLFDTLTASRSVSPQGTPQCAFKCESPGRHRAQLMAADAVDSSSPCIKRESLCFVSDVAYQCRRAFKFTADMMADSHLLGHS